MMFQICNCGTMARRDKKIIGSFVVLILAAGLIFIFGRRSQVIEIDNQVDQTLVNTHTDTNKISPISGLACENYNRRPLAVVLSEDSVTRPLSGISEADLVFEMPVITGGITRMVAVYVCNSPSEVGSLRSARHDFIPLTMGLDAILAHWGGSHFAQDQLANGVMDHIDALTNPYDAFYRKSGTPQPHNGFTTVERLLTSAGKLGYRLEDNFDGYSHIPESYNHGIMDKTLKINYAYPYSVEYKYDAQTNNYVRWRSGKLEIDKNINQSVKAKNVIVMRAISRQIEGPYYNDLEIEGSGECQVFQNGVVVSCHWQKDKNNLASKLYFFDENNREVPFVSGQIWIEIVEPNQKATWN